MDAVRRELQPLVEQFASLDRKVDDLSSDRVRRQDFERLQQEMHQAVKDAEARSYSRELIDQWKRERDKELDGVRASVGDVKDALASQQKAASSQWERVFTRLSLLISSGYILLQLVPHLAKVFS